MSDTLKSRTLDKDALINGRIVEAGTEIQITDEALAEAYAAVGKRRVRAAIATGVGDTESILGDTSDTAQFLLVEFAGLVTRIASAKNLEEIKTAAKVSAEKLSKLNAAVSRGEVVFPFQAKEGGESAVLNEITEKANLVASVLKGGDINTQAVVVSPSVDISREQAPAPYTPVS